MCRQTGEMAGVAQDQMGSLAETGTERRPLELQPSVWDWISRTLNIGFLLRIRRIMNAEFLSQERSPVLI